MPGRLQSRAPLSTRNSSSSSATEMLPRVKPRGTKPNWPSNNPMGPLKISISKPQTSPRSRSTLTLTGMDEISALEFCHANSWMRSNKSTQKLRSEKDANGSWTRTADICPSSMSPWPTLTSRTEQRSSSSGTTQQWPVSRFPKKKSKRSSMPPLRTPPTFRKLLDTF